MLIFSCPLLATRGGLEIARERWVNRLSDLNVILWIRKRKGSRLGGRWLVVRLQWRHLHLIGDSVVSPSRFLWDHVVAATQTQRWSPVDRPIFQECSNATGKAAGNDASTFLFFFHDEKWKKKTAPFYIVSVDTGCIPTDLWLIQSSSGRWEHRDRARKTR